MYRRFGEYVDVGGENGVILDVLFVLKFGIMWGYKENMVFVFEGQ